MPLALQSRLLRVLQEREVLRVGSTAPIPVDVRVIAATHADLADQVERGRFRRDLYYRLAVLRLSTPSLQMRGAADIAELGRAMLAQRLSAASGLPRALHDRVGQQLDALLARAAAHDWPGNVRELDNWVERLLACSDYLGSGRGGLLDMARLLEVFPECADGLALAEPAAARQAQLRDAGRLAEQKRLCEVLESVGGNQRQACEILGISRATLWRRMKA